MEKSRVTTYLENDLVAWIDKLIEEKRFNSRSHALKESVFKMRQFIEGKLLTK